MKLTSKGRCALRAMVELALHQDTRLPVKEIAKRQDLSVRYLEQICASLKKEKLINGTKGPTGGYTLSVTAEEISVAQIVFAVEGRSPFYHNTNQTDVLSTSIDPIWQQLDLDIETYLSSITLASIAKEFKEKSLNQYMYFI